MLIFLIILAVLYAFLNGYRDSSSIMAGVMASRAMNPRLALYLVGVADLIAPLLVGTAVARSITTGLVDTSTVTLDTVIVAMLAALAWNMLSWWLAIPSSSTHSLIGGLLGAVLINHGPSAIHASGVLFVILPLIVAPILGLGVGYLVMRLFLFLMRDATPKVNQTLRHLQVITMMLLATSESSNDAQKSMGMIALGLVLAGKYSSFTIPFWVLALCTFALAFGASRGDWRQIRNLGGHIYHIRPLNALASQVASSGLILTASVIGFPVSSPHVISSALLGSGAAERLNKVRWQLAGKMVLTWLVTIPATMAVSALLFEGITFLQGLPATLHGLLAH
jgi:PiT family inorganic phosphate transporter